MVNRSLTLFYSDSFYHTVCVRPNYDAKTEALKMIGQRSNLCQRHIPRTSFNPKMGWLLYKIKLSRKSIGYFPTINRPHYQQSANPSNRPMVQKLVPCTT